ncbi:MAG: hypothetical protein E6J88_06410 [Deltaproteobacteria bacterium]|nr:MAG: hypothetical protein E6J88_06410 [Deltaproteobacteria bacterium]
MNLAETQRLFWELLQGHEPPLDAFIGSPDLPAGERVAIYISMVLHRQVDALRETFPRVVAVLGDERFFATAAAYVRTHPSEHADLGQLGRHFAAFVERLDVRDLARLEWARGEVFEAAFSEPLSGAHFGSLAQDPVAFMKHTAKLIAALRLLELDHDIGPLWEGTSTNAAPDPVRLVVWRNGFEVFHVAVEPDESRAVRLALASAPLGDICGAFADPQRAFDTLQSWVAEGWIAAS